MLGAVGAATLASGADNSRRLESAPLDVDHRASKPIRGRLRGFCFGGDGISAAVRAQRAVQYPAKVLATVILLVMPMGCIRVVIALISLL